MDRTVTTTVVAFVTYIVPVRVPIEATAERTIILSAKRAPEREIIVARGTPRTDRNRNADSPAFEFNEAAIACAASDMDSNMECSDRSSYCGTCAK